MSRKNQTEEPETEGAVATVTDARAPHDPATVRDHDVFRIVAEDGSLAAWVAKHKTNRIERYQLQILRRSIRADVFQRLLVPETPDCPETTPPSPSELADEITAGKSPADAALALARAASAPNNFISRLPENGNVLAKVFAARLNETRGEGVAESLAGAIADPHISGKAILTAALCERLNEGDTLAGATVDRLFSALADDQKTGAALAQRIAACLPPTTAPAVGVLFGMMFNKDNATRNAACNAFARAFANLAAR